MHYGRILEVMVPPAPLDRLGSASRLNCLGIGKPWPGITWLGIQARNLSESLCSRLSRYTER